MVGLFDTAVFLIPRVGDIVLSREGLCDDADFKEGFLGNDVLAREGLVDPGGLLTSFTFFTGDLGDDASF